MRKKKLAISNTGNFFCFNSNVSSLYNNDVLIYKIKKTSWKTVLFVSEFSYYNISQILKLVHKMNYKHIGLYQLSVTNIRGRIYNIIAGGIVVQIPLHIMTVYII